MVREIFTQRCYMSVKPRDELVEDKEVEWKGRKKRSRRRREKKGRGWADGVVDETSARHGR